MGEHFGQSAPALLAAGVPMIAVEVGLAAVVSFSLVDPLGIVSESFLSPVEIPGR